MPRRVRPLLPRCAALGPDRTMRERSAGRARDPVGSVDHENGTPLMPYAAACAWSARTDEVAAAAQRLARGIRIESGIGAGQYVFPAEVPALGEVESARPARPGGRSPSRSAVVRAPSQYWCASEGRNGTASFATPVTRSSICEAWSAETPCAARFRFAALESQGCLVRASNEWNSTSTTGASSSVDAAANPFSRFRLPM